MTDRATLLRADALASADRLEAVLDRAPLATVTTGPVRFIGLGSSRFAAMTVATALAAGGRGARVETASATPAPPLQGETVFAVSASGRTPEVVAAAAALEGQCAVVAVTNDPSSPLASVGSRCLLLDAGEDRSGIATLTYRATLAVLALATAASAADTLRRAVAATPSPAAGDAPTVQRLDGATTIDVVAPASLLGAAEQAALMLREAPRLRAIAWDAAEWLHTAIYTALPGHRLVVLGQPPHRAEIAATVAARGGEVVDVPVPGGSSEPVGEAIAISVIVELLAADLWQRADSAGA